MKSIQLNTQFNDGETLLFIHKGTIMKGVRVSGHLALTNQRLIWKKSGLANVIGFGIISLAGTEYLSIPATEILSASNYWIPAAAGLKLKLKNGEELKFQLNGNKPKKAREEFHNCFNQQR